MSQDKPAYQDASLPFEQRADDLVSRMSLEQKVSQMVHVAREIKSLHIPEYDWWNECLHGVARAGHATVFPQAIGMAAMWNRKLMHRIATAISDEARAKHHQAVRDGRAHERCRGLTYWTPNINIVRDPRWGRSQETYGEDPYLTGTLGVEFVKGLQGDDPKYLKLVATPKHYAVHSGPEILRHHFDAIASKRDLVETYLPAFKMCVQEAKAESIMSAYSRLNGEPCTGSKWLLTDLLRDKWGFNGYVVSDCGAVRDIFAGHKSAPTPKDAAAMAVNAGCDLNCGMTYYLAPPAALIPAVEEGLVSEETLDTCLKRLMLARFRLGMFDPPEIVPWAKIPFEKNDCPEHHTLCREAARQSITLLKNENGALPLKTALKRIAVIGPLADDRHILIGNYNGTPSSWTTPLEGIRKAVSESTRIDHIKGCDMVGENREEFPDAVEMARLADAVILCMGISPAMEGEEGEEALQVGTGDRDSLELPGVQEELIQKIVATGKPVVLVLTGGSSLSFVWPAQHIPAIVMAWYPGQFGGDAIADVLFGDYNPAGRLPVTFYQSTDQLPDFRNYDMQGRTYRYMDEKPLYPFGYGISYTTFVYKNLKTECKSIPAGESIGVSIDVTNTGKFAGDEVVQLYLKHKQASQPVANLSLVGYDRVHLEPGQTQTVSFTVKAEQMKVVDDYGKCTVEPGEIELTAASCAPVDCDFIPRPMQISTAFEVTGKTTEIPFL